MNAVACEPVNADSSCCPAKVQKLHNEAAESTECCPSETTAQCTQIPLYVTKLCPEAQLPKRASQSAAGYDLCSSVECVVPAHGKALVPTGLSIAVPPGTYGRVAPRSGLAHKNFIDVGAGVVDEDYRGPLGIILFNFSDVDFVIKVGDRVAQLVLEKIATPDVVEVEVFNAFTHF